MNAKKKVFTIMLLTAAVIMAGVLAETGFAETAPAMPNALNQNDKVTVEGNATIYGTWACDGGAIVKAIPGQALAPVPGFPGGVKAALAVVTVQAIECGDNTMNKHLRKALKDKDYPEIRFQMDKYELENSDGDVTAYGELTIAGVTKPIELNATLTPLPQGGVRVLGKVDIQMKDYGVKPPSLLFGTLKVANEISVKFDTTVRPPGEEQQISAAMKTR